MNWQQLVGSSNRHWNDSKIYVGHKRKTAKLQNQTEKYKDEIDEELDEIKTAVANYQKKLMAAVSGMENESEQTVSIPQQVKSGSKR
jgi:hypothetical protein